MQRWLGKTSGAVVRVACGSWCQPKPVVCWLRAVTLIDIMDRCCTSHEQSLSAQQGGQLSRSPLSLSCPIEVAQI